MTLIGREGDCLMAASDEQKYKPMMKRNEERSNQHQTRLETTREENRTGWNLPIITYRFRRKEPQIGIRRANLFIRTKLLSRNQITSHHSISIALRYVLLLNDLIPLYSIALPGSQ